MRITRANSMALAAVLYAVGLCMVTVSPLNSWRTIPQPPWEYLFAPWPRYWTGFDVLVNVIAYIPLGLLISRAVTRRRRISPWRPLQGFLLALMLGLLLSVVLEALQTYLPSRRPSILDVVTNTVGTAIGAFFSSVYAQSRDRLPLVMDGRPLEIGAAMLISLWMLAQAAPQQIWLTLGDVLPHDSWRPVLGWFLASPDISSAIEQELFAAQRVLAEALCVTGALLGSALVTHLTLLQSNRWFPRYGPRQWLPTLLATVSLTLAVRAIWIWLLLSPEALLAWFNAGVQAGLVLAMLSAYALAGVRPERQRLAAILGLLLMVILANSLPQNIYATDALLGWSRGRWLNLQSLADLAAMIWPFAALAWLLLALRQREFMPVQAPRRRMPLYRPPR
jgi:VanZ family protein